MSSKLKVYSKGNVPFSWEDSPGIPRDCPSEKGHSAPKLLLPPLPCTPESFSTARASFRDLQVPLPPCAFQSPLRGSSFSTKGVKKKGDHDPFLMAYKECTKSNTTRKGNINGGVELNKNKSVFSCKHSCTVRDDSIVRISQLPSSKSQSEKERERRRVRDGFICEV